MIILLSGKPGVGKSTIIEKFITDYNGLMSWVVTKEIRDSKGKRVGFKAINFLNEEGIISHKFNIQSNIIIGANRVDLLKIDQLFTRTLSSSHGNSNDLTIIDEIGPIQLLSKKFIQQLDRLFTSGSNLLTTIHFNDNRVEKYKKNPKTILFEVSEENREILPVVLLDIFGNIKYLNQFTENQKDKIRETVRKYAKEGKFLEIRKLFKNALGYLLKKRITSLGNSNFEVCGDHGKYKVTKVNDDNYKCECDFFLGKGKYKKAGECSHIQAIKLFKVLGDIETR